MSRSDTDPENADGAQVYRLFQQNGVGLKVTKYFDYHAMTSPVAVSI
ncbi:hypothetical protein [Paraburkholderia caledonica]